MQLGRGSLTDVMSISLAGTDYVGHTYGTEGAEMCLQLFSLDRDLGDFFRLLDSRGIDYMVVLTADHGGQDIPERRRLHGVAGAARVDSKLSAKDVGAAVGAQLGLKGPILYGEGSFGDMYVDRALSQSDQAREAVADLRDGYIPTAFAGVDAEVVVGGMTASGIDDTNIIADHTLPVFAFVLGFSFIILLVVFRSIVVPLKAMVMNLLSVGAAYGLMVLVFQHGVGNELFGFSTVERIETWVPLFMFAVLFGLSMDYHVFLLSRIKEHYDETGDNAASVVHGLRSTAGIITGAALIMVAVFAGMASGELVVFQQVGFGLAMAVIIDATIIRMVLVPASMELLGDWNWYFPRWLEWLPRVNIEGDADRL